MARRIEHRTLQLSEVPPAVPALMCTTPCPPALPGVVHVPFAFSGSTQFLQCELGRKVDSREECHWSHACSLQASEHAWDPIASSSAKSCRKTMTVPLHMCVHSCASVLSLPDSPGAFSDVTEIMMAAVRADIQEEAEFRRKPAPYLRKMASNSDRKCCATTTC
jgi:hypothetical protein